MKKVTVIVTADKFGTHKKGDSIEMDITTARAVAKHKIVKFDDPESEDNDGEKVKAKDAIAAIKQMETVEEIETYTKDETRETVIAAATARIAELSK